MTFSGIDSAGSGKGTPEISNFEEKLRYNLDRFAKILLDEQQHQESTRHNSSCSNPLLTWLEDDYGTAQVERLKMTNFQTLSSKDQRSHLQDFLGWFRQEFPYYRDQCDHCDAKGCEFKGNQKPTEEERNHSPFIDNTEVYECGECHKTTRFPRYLAAMEIVRRKRGRCSEYSLLLYRILRALGHKSRWTVDWANHIWAEVWMDDRWIHVDPCEASMDAPLLYQGWGKKQTYILAFEAPPLISEKGQQNGSNRYTITDVTQSYTSEDWEAIQARRSEDGATLNDIDGSLERAVKRMDKLMGSGNC